MSLPMTSSLLEKFCCCMMRPKLSGPGGGEGMRSSCRREREWAAADMQCVLLYSKDMKGAMAEISARGGYVILKLSRFLLVAMLPPSLKLSLLKLSTRKSPSKRSLDTLSKRMLHAWSLVKLKSDTTTVDRPIPLVITGSVAVALLVVSGQPSDLQFSDSEITNGVLTAVLEGANSLALSQASAEPSAHLSFSFEQLFITISPSENVPGTGITDWPAAVSFQDKLYCFHQGRYLNAKRLMYNVFDGTSWAGDVIVPNTTATEGPSAVVFNDKIYCFHQGHDTREEVWYNIFDGSSWEGDQQVPNTRITAGPSVLVYDNKLYCFHQGWTGNDNEFWYNVFDGSTWEGDKLVDDTSLTASPSAVVFQDLIYCFYQGIKEYEKVLLMNVFDPATEVWSGHSKVPLNICMSEGPSAVVFNEKLYVFYQGANDTGMLWFNTTSDGVIWKGSTPVADIRMVVGPGTGVFDGGLYCFYQGADDNEGTVWYRSFDSDGSLEWERLWADPALQQLGYSSGYGGFVELAEAVRTNNSTDYGYVACITKFPLLYSAYADGTRLSIEYPNDNISTTFAQIFDSSGKYDIASDDTSTEPRYTFALSSALREEEVPIALNATNFVFHQGAEDKKRLWFSLLDRRTSRWVEMQGPETSTTFSGACALLYNSKTYVFYTQDGGGSLFFNVLEGTSWNKEQIVPNTNASAPPSAVIFDSKLYCFHQGGDNKDELWYNVLDIESSTWEGDIQVPNTDTEFGASAVVFKDKLYCFNEVHNATGNWMLFVNVFNGTSWKGNARVPNTFLTGQPSAVVYNDKIYCFHQGGKHDGSLWYNVYDESKWEGDKQVDLVGLKVSDGPSVVVSDGKVYCFFRAKATNTQLWYNVLDGSNGWTGPSILTTGSGTSTQPGAVSIDSNSIAWDSCPA